MNFCVNGYEVSAIGSHCPYDIRLMLNIQLKKKIRILKGGSSPVIFQKYMIKGKNNKKDEQLSVRL